MAKKKPQSQQKWIQGAIQNPGSLRRQLGVSQGQKIPVATLQAAANETDAQGKTTTKARRARLALRMRAFNK